MVVRKPSFPESQTTVGSMTLELEHILSDWEMDPEKIKLISLLGSGAYGQV